MKQKYITAILFFLLLSASGFAQNLTQTVRGTLMDKQLQTPLQGAVIIVIGTEISAVSDSTGLFILNNVPIGRRDFKVSLPGYFEVNLTNILVTSGKELIINPGLEEEIKKLEGATIKGRKKTINEMASPGSTRSFTVEETQKFPAAINDPSRMATSFAGVVGADDGQNLIVIRGNAPNGLLWKVEGVDVPNPNHFASVGTSGGGISILSAQLMANSDFMTGAFSSEYGNALSGVFDMRLRKGNNNKREYTFQAGVLGIDLAAEGPFKKGYKGSYLVNYRYSTLGLLAKANILPQDGITTFQDLSFNLSFPAGKAGNFSVFGFGGISKSIYAP
ncbi:MAG: carboxypeptidase regulatory-like domain-containing protein, partial [Bacteroidia bacterium]|nr:carboxypeptidase regulatory-like domain-containing protein [Bacteroidia bacterium]